jgi:DHA1 family multidrug resistance protein-like MFS transporter
VSNAVQLRTEESQIRTHPAFLRLCAAAFLAYCSYAICRTPLVPLYARELGADAPTIGLVMGASTVTGILVKLPAGAWSDVLGRRPLLVTGALIFALMPFSYFGATTIAALAIVRFVHGSATAIFGPVSAAAVSDIAPAHRRATWLSTYATVTGLGAATGAMLAGFLVAGGYGRAFAVAGALAIATPLIVVAWPAKPEDTGTLRNRVSVLSGIAGVVRHPLILMTSLVQAVQLTLHGTLGAFLPLFASEQLGLEPAHIGVLFAVQTLTTLATRPMIGALSDRVGRRSIIVAGLTLCSAAALLISLAERAPMLVAGVITYAIGTAVTTAAASAYITDLSHREQYGAAHGVFGTIYDVGDALGPIAAGFIVASIGYAHMFQTMAALVALAAVVFATATRRG